MSTRRWMVLVAVVVALGLPIAAVASHQFNDVPDSHIFHNSIDWLANEGITVGCNPPANNRFCPDDNVTRGQMATFLKRFYDRFLASGQASPVGLGEAFRTINDAPFVGNGIVTGMSMTLHIPGPGVIFFDASAEVFAGEIDALLCGINVGGSSALAIPDSWRTIDLTLNVADTCATQTAVVANGGGTGVGRLVISSAAPSTQVGAGNIRAVFYPADSFVGLLSTKEQTEAPEVLDVQPEKVTSP